MTTGAIIAISVLSAVLSAVIAALVTFAVVKRSVREDIRRSDEKTAALFAQNAKANSESIEQMTKQIEDNTKLLRRYYDEQIALLQYKINELPEHEQAYADASDTKAFDAASENDAQYAEELFPRLKQMLRKSNVKKIEYKVFMKKKKDK